MVHCPILLKRKKDQGISITELLIVVAVIAILMVVLLAAFKPSTQLAKARDARRKADLQKLKNPLEDYYNDKKCYPETLNSLKPDYIGQVPADPLTGQLYQIYTEGCDKYRIYTKLEFGADSVIVQSGCGAGCGPGGNGGTGETRCASNYGVCSSNTKLEGCTEKCADFANDICPELTAEQMVNFGYCGTGSCCPGSQPKMICAPPERPWCCPE